MNKRQRKKLDAVKAKWFVYDGCHKIFLIRNEADKKYAFRKGWKKSDLRPFDRDIIEELYDTSCVLKAIWWMSKEDLSDVIPQRVTH